MKLRTFLLRMVLLSLAPAGLAGQANLSVDLQDSVYQLLELGELRGALSRLSGVRPYSHRRIVKLLEQMWGNRDRFSPAEQAVLAGVLRRFGEEPSGLQVGVDVRSRFRLNANSPRDWHTDSVVRPYLRGDLAPWLSYLGVLGFTLDRVRADQAFPPYGFSKQWDAIHLSLGELRYSDGSLDYPTISYNLETEIAAQLLRDTVRLQLARQRREWGIGDGSLTLGSTARPFVGAETHVELAPWLFLHQLLGSLGNWELEPGGLTDRKGFGTLSP